MENSKMEEEIVYDWNVSREIEGEIRDKKNKEGE